MHYNKPCNLFGKIFLFPSHSNTLHLLSSLFLPVKIHKINKMVSCAFFTYSTIVPVVIISPIRRLCKKKLLAPDLKLFLKRPMHLKLYRHFHHTVSSFMSCKYNHLTVKPDFVITFISPR